MCCCTHLDFSEGWVSPSWRLDHWPRSWRYPATCTGLAASLSEAQIELLYFTLFLHQTAPTHREEKGSSSQFIPYRSCAINAHLTTVLTPQPGTARRNAPAASLYWQDNYWGYLSWNSLKERNGRIFARVSESSCADTPHPLCAFMDTH